MKPVLPIIAVLTMTMPAWAAPETAIPPDVIAEAEAVLALSAVAPSQPVVVGTSGWLQTSPITTMHYIFSASAPFGNTPWGMQTDYVPTLGTGHFSVSHRFHAGPVALYPSLGYRFFGAAATTGVGFLNGPQAQFGASYPLLPWLAISGSVAYSPYLQLMNAPGAGSYFDFSAAAVASFERLSISLGYTGLLIDATRTGAGAFGGSFKGGPTLGMYTHF